jgi:hypothetical protein
VSFRRLSAVPTERADGKLNIDSSTDHGVNEGSCHLLIEILKI